MQFLGVGFAAGYMVAKGSDLVQTALFVKRAFIELLKKVVNSTTRNSSVNFQVMTYFPFIELRFKTIKRAIVGCWWTMSDLS